MNYKSNTALFIVLATLFVLILAFFVSLPGCTGYRRRVYSPAHLYERHCDDELISGTPPARNADNIPYRPWRQRRRVYNDPIAPIPVVPVIPVAPVDPSAAPSAAAQGADDEFDEVDIVNAYASIDIPYLSK